MIILPAIDIIDRKAVRLYQGDYDKKEIVGEDVFTTAKDFERLGAEYIHIVDLDGAKEGYVVNEDVILRLAKELKIPIEVGGGIRSFDTIKRLLDNGVSRVILGTIALEDEELLRKAVKTYKEKISIGIDCKNGYVCGRGWLSKSDLTYLDFAQSMQNIGVKNIIFTDISKDGTLEGPNFEMIEDLQNEIDIDITASGGIRDIENIKKLKEMNIYGVITGKAIYSGTLSLEEAIDISKK